MNTITLPTYIKAIIVGKVLVLIGAGLVMTEQVKLGDLSLFAQTEEAPATPSPPINEATPATDAPADGYLEAEKPVPTRKSFLDELFSVPEINTDPLQKEEVGRYLTLVERKKKQVDERVGLLQAREQRMLEIEKSIDDKLKRLDDEKRYFADTLQKEKQMNDERTTQLVEFYKKMTPKSAAPVFEKLDKDLVVHLFSKLPQKQITSILSLMKPETSVKLTEYYSRLRSGREYELLREINKSLTEEFQSCKGM